MTDEERDALVKLILGPVRDWAVSMVPRSGGYSTYGVDVAGKCAELVQKWPDVGPVLQRIRIDEARIADPGYQEDPPDADWRDQAVAEVGELRVNEDQRGRGGAGANPE